MAITDDGSTIVLGAYIALVNNQLSAGALYLYRRPTTGWTTSTENTKLTAAHPLSDDEMGYSLGITGDGATIVAGAPVSSEPILANGAVFVFSSAPMVKAAQRFSLLGKKASTWRSRTK